MIKKELCPLWLFPILQKMRAIKDIIIFDFFKILKKMDRKRILFYAVSRNSLSGNLQFIYDKIDKSKFDVIVITEKDQKSRTKILKEIAISKIIIIDDYAKIFYPLTMRKQAKFIQVWHSTGAFKRMGFARMGKQGSTISSSLTHKNYTDVIVSSEFVRKNFAEAFGISIEKIHALGVARTDIFFDKNYIETKKAEIIKKFPVLTKKKLILFAPTFRGDTREKAYYPSDYIDIKSLYDNFNDEYVLGIKMHPFIKDAIEIPKQYNDFVIDFSSEREINDLLFVTDTLITDYSSVIFEYALLDKKIIFYAPDLESYTNSRDFFYEYSNYLYGDLARNFDELIKCIKSVAIEKKASDDFKDKFLSACDGNSSQRVVDNLIKE